MNVITSLDNEKVKLYKKLQKKKYRGEYNLFIVEGEHLVLEAFKAGILEELILQENVSLPIPSPYCYFSREVMAKISLMDTPSTIMGLCRKKEDTDVLGDRILILEDIQDPGNLGTIIRSALAFNVSTIVLSENTVDLYNYKVLRATQGMLFHMNIVITDIEKCIRTMQSLDIPVYGTCVDDGYDIRDIPKEERNKYVLVMGNEGNGVSRRILSLCDKNLYIKMNKKVESLNVAVAASILLYELGD